MQAIQTKVQHTQGEWEVAGKANENIIVRKVEDGKTINYVWIAYTPVLADKTPHTDEERHANAKLIAAGPDLLEYAECDLLYENIGSFFFNGDTYTGKVAQIQLKLMRAAAIKKATL